MIAILMLKSFKLRSTIRISAISLLVLAHNTGARRLYDRLGYREAARDRIVLEAWPPSPAGILLMVKQV